MRGYDTGQGVDVGDFKVDIFGIDILGGEFLVEETS